MCLGCKSASRTPTKQVCMHMYNELVELDLRALSIYQGTKNSDFIKINKQIRAWIKNLRTSCPPESDLNLIRTIINEYTIDQ